MEAFFIILLVVAFAGVAVTAALVITKLSSGQAR